MQMAGSVLTADAAQIRSFWAPTKKLAADDANRVQPLAVDEDIGAFRAQHLAVGKVHLPMRPGYQLSGIVVRQAC
jgi:hypothetical protein